MNYDYPNARIRGMRSRLLDHRTLDELIRKPDINSLIVELEKTPYRDDIADAGIRYSGIYSVEYALRRNYTRTFKKIMGIFEGQPAEAYLRIFLHRWDIQNVKTILRGKSFHIPQDEVFECLVPAGDLDEVTMGEMIRQPDVRSIVDLLATWRVPYAKPLTRRFPEYAGERNLIVLESALDQYYYRNGLDAVRGDDYDQALVRDMLSTEIDVVNVKTVLRLIRDKIGGQDAGRFLIDGGNRLRRSFLTAMLDAKSLEAALNMLKGTRYGFLADVPPELFKGEKVSEFEKRLDRFLIARGLRAFSRDPLSIAVAIGYYWAKYNEITNLRVIARCKTADVPDETIREALYYV
ncbi:MAG: V-type ATP synthase subunit C [Methanocella sp. PtaU1.Bin125]|nr:MAG: V-type ATP synthase subunit C [Methanocella sp. PtaU1.Bin125]